MKTETSAADNIIFNALSTFQSDVRITLVARVDPKDRKMVQVEPLLVEKI